MSVQVLSWVLDHSPAKGADRLVLISLANHAEPDGGETYPAVRRVARESRLSRRTVQLALRSLEAGGAIIAEGEGPNGEIRYRVRMDDQAKAFRSAARPRYGDDDEPESDTGQGGATFAPPAQHLRGAQHAPKGGANHAPEGRNMPSRGINRPLSRPEPSNPPLPPKGGRARERKDFEERLSAYAQRLLPEARPEDAAPAVAGAIASGAHTTAAVLEWLERWRPDLAAAACPLRP